MISNSRSVRRGQTGNKLICSLAWLLSKLTRSIFLSPFQCLLKQDIRSMNFFKKLIYFLVISLIYLYRDVNQEHSNKGRKRTESNLHLLPQNLLFRIIKHQNRIYLLEWVSGEYKYPQHAHLAFPQHAHLAFPWPSCPAPDTGTSL